MTNKKKIGFLSFWGWGRGQSYVTLAYTKMIKDNYDVYILKQGKNPINPEFDLEGVNIMEVPDYDVDPNVFETWIKANKLDAVVFNEYNQWKDDGADLINVAKRAGAKAYGYLVWEKWAGKEAYADYDRLIAPTISFERFYRTNKIRNFTYIPYSVDLNEFTTQTGEENKKFTFFHPGGWGGVHNRKNTEAVVKAFASLDNDDCELVITSQKPIAFESLPRGVRIINRDLTRKELIQIYYESDCVILPSKWETVGLPILESLAAGKPVITTNAPPMNEFIKEGLNGYIVPTDMIKYPDIGIYACDVSPMAIKNKMINVQNKMLYKVLTRNSRYIAENLYDLEKNKKYFIDFLEKDLQ